MGMIFCINKEVNMISNTLQKVSNVCFSSFFQELPLARLLEGIWICNIGQKNHDTFTIRHICLLRKGNVTGVIINLNTG